MQLRAYRQANRGEGKGVITDIDRLRGEGASRTWTYTLDATGSGVKKALFSDDPFSLQPLSNTPCGLALQCHTCSARIRLFPSQVHSP